MGFISPLSMDACTIWTMFKNIGVSGIDTQVREPAKVHVLRADIKHHVNEQPHPLIKRQGRVHRGLQTESNLVHQLEGNSMTVAFLES